MSVIKGIDVAKQMSLKLLDEVEQIKAEGINPMALLVRVGENPSCIAYERGAAKKLESVGIQVKYATFAEDITQEEFESAFIKCNENPGIHGILLLRPLPSQLDEKAIGNIINPLKDVDAINPLNMYKVMVGDKTAFPPCTPEAVMRIIDYIGVDLTGKRAVIVGASMVVGLPLFLLMLNRNATCTQCHIFTKTSDMASICKKAEILVVAAGKRALITKDYISQGTIVIDVGINVDENGKIHGDVAFDEVESLTDYITPVPGGVGSVTTTVLAEHVVKAVRLLHK